MGEEIALPMAREGRFDPPAELARLRARAPLHRLRYRDGRVGWLVTGHRAARMLMTDSRFGLRPPRPFPIEDPDKHAAVLRAIGQAGLTGADLLLLDPPDHTRIRKLIASELSIDRVATLRARIEAIVAAKLESMAAAGPPADLVADFAKPVVLATHCVLLGVGEEAGPLFERVATASIDPDLGAEQMAIALGEFQAFLRGAIAAKRRLPGDDLMSSIVRCERLSEAEIESLLFLIFAAGVDTTVAMLALGPMALLSHPQQLRTLRSEPGLVDGAVDELMRYLTVFQAGAFTRTAHEDVRFLGETIRAGEAVTVSLAAANRDPDRFESPDALDVGRRARGHLGFGHGIHTCLGQHLARMEMQVAIRELLARFPRLGLATALDQVPLSGHRHLIFTAERLPVRW